jgi:hypothetical protein
MEKRIPSSHSRMNLELLHFGIILLAFKAMTQQLPPESSAVRRGSEL